MRAQTPSLFYLPLTEHKVFLEVRASLFKHRWMQVVAGCIKQPNFLCGSTISLLSVSDSGCLPPQRSDRPLGRQLALMSRPFLFDKQFVRECRNAFLLKHKVDQNTGGEDGAFSIASERKINLSTGGREVPAVNADFTICARHCRER